MATETAFEALLFAVESTHGTAIAQPTHYMQLEGSVTPTRSRNRRSRSTGMLEEYHASAITRKGAEWEASGDVDLNILPTLLRAAVKGSATTTTPVGATDARLHEFIPTMTSDDLKSLTVWWGDPNNQVFQSTYCMVDELTISNNASSEDGAQLDISGAGKAFSKVADPTLPTFGDVDLLIGQRMQLWIDTGEDDIGTTEISGRLISAEHALTNNLSYKHLAGGPTSDLSFTKHGRGKRHLETTIVLELEDTTQFDQYDDGDVMKVRVRHNGGLIEGSLYSYLEVDTYGPMDFGSWGDNEGTNRTIELTITSEYHDDINAGWRMAVQNTQTTV